MIKFATCIFKARIGGESCLAFFFMHKGYCAVSKFLEILGEWKAPL